MIHRSQQKKAVVIHSPHSDRSDLLTEALATLQKTAVEPVHVLSIAELDTLPNQGTNWKSSGIDLAIAAGGDGVVGGVITHIAESGLPLGILPLGTANDIARSLHIPQQIRQAVQVLAQGKVLAIDLGQAEPVEQAPHTTSKDQKQLVQRQVTTHRQSYFAHALTTGMNVQFARLATNIATRKHFGHLTYPLSALDVLFDHSAIETEVRFTGLALASKDQAPVASPEILVEDMIFGSRALQITVINAPVFGGRWNLALPRAALNDHLLDIVIIEDIGLPHPLTTFTQWFTQPPDNVTAIPKPKASNTRFQAAELSKIPGIHHVQAHSVVITTTIDPQDVTLDGEIRGQTPISVSVAAQSLHVFVP